MKKLVWRIRIIGSGGSLQVWEPPTEPSVVWRDDGRAVIQWKKHRDDTAMGLASVYVAAGHTFSIVPIELDEESK